MRILTALGLTLMVTTSHAQTSWIVTQDDVTQSFANQFGDTLGDQLDSGFAVLDTQSKRALVRLDPSLESSLQRAVHDNHHRCGGYTIFSSEAAALAELNNPFFDTAYLNRAGLFPTTLDQQADVGPALNMVSAGNILSTINWMQNQGTRYYQSAAGAAAAQTLKNQWEGYATRPDFSVTTASHAWLQDSVIATITGASESGEVIVIGGHLDSINSSDTNAAPGADDNASGIAVVSEILRVMLASDFKPQRTLKFIGYAAEEVGLRGSREIAEDMVDDPAVDVIAALQFDMTGFSGSTNDMYFVSDYVSTDLTNYMKLLIGEYHGAGTHQITYGDTSCGYACSDHAAWTGEGVPATFPFEAQFADYNDQIHSSGDVLSALDTTGAKQTKFAKLGVAFAMELAKSTATTPPPAPQAKGGYVWAHDATSASYTPITTYAHNSSGGPITITRSGIGRYAVRFSGLGGTGRPGANVQVTGYGSSQNDCKIRYWSSSTTDLIASVQCLSPAGQLTDDRYTVLVTWP